MILTLIWTYGPYNGLVVHIHEILRLLCRCAEYWLVWCQLIQKVSVLESETSLWRCEKASLHLRRHTPELYNCHLPTGVRIEWPSAYLHSLSFTRVRISNNVLSTHESKLSIESYNIVWVHVRLDCCGKFLRKFERQWVWCWVSRTC